MKLYNTEHQFKAITGRDEKTFRKYAWRWAHLLAYYLDVIDLENRFDGDPPDDLAFRCFVSLDGTDFSIYEPTPFDAKWYSHKLNGPGLRYEIGICLRTGDIVWVNGGVPCGEYPDLKLAREGYLNIIDEGELTIADDGYQDAAHFIYPQRYPEIGARLKVVMSRHETVNKRMKQWGCLKQRFRHRRILHPVCFRAVANLTQLTIMLG